MKITKYLHSCLLIEKDSAKLLFDPGKFSFIEGFVKPEQFTNLTAVLITHGHPDHLELDALKKILANNPEAEVLGNTETLKKLTEAGIRARTLEDDLREVGVFTVQAIPATHDPILGMEPPQNTAFLIDGKLLNPGDSFATSLHAHAGIEALVVPVSAPWGNELQMMAFVEAMHPHAVIPVHDGHAKPFFIAQRYETFAREFKKRNIEFADLQKPGDSFTIA